MAKKLNSMRWLDALGVRYDVLAFPDTVQSAVGVATYYGLPLSQVYKTLVVVLAPGKPALVVVAGDREIHLKRLAQALGAKKLRMATQREAEQWTGLRVGGISALALHQRGFPVYVDRAAADLDAIVVSAGQRGLDVRLAVTDFLRVTGASFVEATAPPAPAAAHDARHPGGSCGGLMTPAILAGNPPCAARCSAQAQHRSS